MTRRVTVISAMAMRQAALRFPEKGVDFYAAREGVPHGEVRAHWYHSKITGKWRRGARLYNHRQDYEKNPQARFPVLYLQHGAGENESGWIEQGHANFILDNLIRRWKSQADDRRHRHGLRCTTRDRDSTDYRRPGLPDPPVRLRT